MNLMNASPGNKYLIESINADDCEITDFLFSLGCYSGEYISLISRLKSGCVVAIKNNRYNIDRTLAEAIII